MMEDMAMGAWKSRGVELNAIYDTLAATIRRLDLREGVVPTAIPSAEAACIDIEALGAEVERLREAIDSALRTTWTEDEEGGWGTSEDRLHSDRLTALAALVPHWQAWGDQAWDAAGRAQEELHRLRLESTGEERSDA